MANKSRIGRVNIKVERLLGVQAKEDMNVYVDDSYLDEICVKRPNDYLQFLHQIEVMLKTPDFVARDGEADLLYMKEYVKNNKFRKALLKVHDRGDIFVFESLGCCPSTEYEDKTLKVNFVRFE